MTQTNSFMSYANNSSFDGRNCPSAFACDNACATYEAANESANGGAAYIVAVPLFLVALVFVIISVVSVIARAIIIAVILVALIIRVVGILHIIAYRNGTCLNNSPRGAAAYAG